MALESLRYVIPQFTNVKRSSEHVECHSQVMAIKLAVLGQKAQRLPELNTGRESDGSMRAR